MSTHADNRETIRLAILVAIRAHVPAWGDSHVHWDAQPASFGADAGTGVIELREISDVLEADHDEYNVGLDVTESIEVYRMAVDVVCRLAGANTKDVAGKLLNAIKRQDFQEALEREVGGVAGHIKIVRIGKTLLPFNEGQHGRREENWRFELNLRHQIKYTSAAETKTTIGTVEYRLTALPDFVNESITVTE